MLIRNFIKHLLLSLTLGVIFFSCAVNNACEKDFEGTFKLYMPYFKDSAIANFVKRKNWDTVSLVSKSNGEFYLNSSDVKLKESEGHWFVESSNIEGDCIGYIKQNNLKHALPTGPFVISIFDSIQFSMQFVKVHSL